MLRRLVPLVVVSVLAATAGLTGTATARPADPPSPVIRIIGGDTTDQGEYPWLVSIELHTSGTFEHRCGGTVVAPAWVLTAAHCVFTRSETARPVAPGDLRIRAGDHNRLAAAIHPVAAVHPHPAYTPTAADGRSHDVALIRLAHPTKVTPLALVGEGPGEQPLDDPGVEATVIGWGVTVEGGDVTPISREVTVPVQDDEVCGAAYPPPPQGSAPVEYRPDTMLCAGPVEGGRDACQGDSGGPLVAPSGSGWRLIGIVSWGLGCAVESLPGVYHRVDSSRSWVSATTRFGPFAPDGAAFVHRQYLDFANRRATAAEQSMWAQRFGTSAPSRIVIGMGTGPGYDNMAGTIARMWRLSLGAYPSTNGYRSLVPQRWAGVGLPRLAPFFVAAHAGASDVDFVSHLYREGMGAEIPATTRNAWTSALGNGFSRSDVLVIFSQWGPIRDRLSAEVRVSTIWYAMLDTAPPPWEITRHRGQPLAALADRLLHSEHYARLNAG